MSLFSDKRILWKRTSDNIWTARVAGRKFEARQFYWNGRPDPRFDLLEISPSGEKTFLYLNLYGENFHFITAAVLTTLEKAN